MVPSPQELQGELLFTESLLRAHSILSLEL